MAILANRAKMTTATTGTGTVTLGSASSNAFCTFAEAGITDGQTVAYLIEDGTDFEIGTGVYTSSGTTMTRASVTLSKISGTSGTSKVNLSGSATVSIVLRKEDLFAAPSNDGAALGASGTAFSDLFLASGGVINFDAGDVTLTHSANAIAIAGGVTALDASSTVGGNVIATAGRQTIYIPASAMIPRTTNGAAFGTVEKSTNKNMFKTLDFDTTTQEFAQFTVWFPKSWNLSTVTFQPVWSHAATTTNFGVAFGLAGVAVSNDDAGDVAFGTAQTSVDTGGTTDDIYIGPESSAITIAGTPAAEDFVMFQLNRTVADAGDTMAIDARLHGIRLFFTTNAATDT